MIKSTKVQSLTEDQKVFLKTVKVYLESEIDSAWEAEHSREYSWKRSFKEIQECNRNVRLTLRGTKYALSVLSGTLKNIPANNEMLAEWQAGKEDFRLVLLKARGPKKACEQYTFFEKIIFGIFQRYNVGNTGLLWERLLVEPNFLDFTDL